VDGTPMHTLPRGDAHQRRIGRVEMPKAPRVGSGSWEGVIAQKADYLDKIIWQMMHPLN